MSKSKSALQERIATNFQAQGLMKTLGAELVQVIPGEVHIALRTTDNLTQQHGYVHAGALTSVVDSACGYAALTVAPPGWDVLSVEFKVNLLRPALGDRILAIGSVIKAGRTLTVCRGEAIAEHQGQEKVVALMQATIMNVPGD